LDPRGDLRAVSALAGLRGTPVFRRRREAGGVPVLGASNPSLAAEADLDLYLAHRYLPWRRERGRLVIATADTSAANLAWLSRFAGAHIAPIAIGDLDRAIARRFRDRLSRDAVFSLWSRMPALSARQTFTRPQAVTLIAVCLTALAAICLWPLVAAQILVGAMSAGFAVSATFRAVLALSGRRNKPVPAPRCQEHDLPVYTILVPLYHEAAILPDLVRALSTLEYPRERLDIKLIVEEDDKETCDAAKEAPYEVLRVPFSVPRTKPKACNYALRFARGEFLVIYDAEDRPEPDQLRKAVDSFRLAPRETVCLQARLAIYNAQESLLARMFALDYAVWFKALLPGLDRLRLPMPLGGTSNHFRTEALREAGGWDPFNVTEDADLGIRLARRGMRVTMLDSTTFEEAPARLGAWLKQRSRWLKGYMQTWLVHARDPLGLTRRVGLRGAAMLQLFLGGAIWSAFVNPILWLIFALSFAYGRHGPQILDALAWIAGLGLLTANLMLAGLVIADAKRKWRALPYALCFTFYWALIAIAGYRALWQLVFTPFYWEKTPHGQTRDGTHGP